MVTYITHDSEFYDQEMGVGRSETWTKGIKNGPMLIWSVRDQGELMNVFHLILTPYTRMQLQSYEKRERQPGSTI